ncbi:MAG: EI24 domain-containing protein [Neisseriaceae bacterium]|nr:EI24 domain-containing protein [Neisseriaceae bacterium]
MWQEIGISLSLGVKESFKIRYFLMLFLLWFTLFCVWAGVYFAFGSTIATTVNAFVEQGFTWLSQPMPAFFKTIVLALGYVTGLLLLALALLVSLWLAIELILMPLLQHTILPNYPHLSNHYASASLIKTSWFLLTHYAQFFLFMLCCLFIPIVGHFLLLWVSAYYTSTALVRDALDGVVNFNSQTQLIHRTKISLTLIGVVCLCLTFIPFVGLLAPLVFGASITHFCFRNVFTPEQQRQFHCRKPVSKALKP